MSRVDERSRTDATDQPRVLAVTTTFRSAEITGPMEHVDGGVSVVVEAGANPLVRALTSVRDTRREIRTHRPDVALLNCFGITGFCAGLVCLAYGVPVVPRLVGDPWAVTDEEGISRARREGPLALAVEYAYLYLSRLVISWARGFVVVSNELADRTVERTGIPADRVGVVPVPLQRSPDGDPSRGRREAGVETPHVLLTVTNLGFRNKYRGVVETLDALRPLLERHEDVTYVVAGGGTYLEDLRAYVDGTLADSPARERVRVLGHVDRVFDCYAMADAFVYVSYIDGYPNAVLEAQSAGLPVVANPAFGMLDMVRDGENGFLVDPARPGEIRAAVERLLDDPATRDRLGAAGRERVARENEPDVVGRQLVDALSAVLEA